MVYVPRILKVVSNKVLKPVALTGVALVQAHPVAAAFTVVVIVGLGLAIYYTKHSKNRKKEDCLTYLSDENMVYSGDANNYFYDPETKSITTDIPISTASYEKKTLRKRQVAQSASSADGNNPLHTQDNRKSNLTISKGRDDEISCNDLKPDNDKILSDDIIDTARILTKEDKVNEYIRNLSETEFMESNDRPADESNYIETIGENTLYSLSDSNSQTYWIDNTFLDLNDFKSESSLESLLSEQSDWCRACRKNPVNTRTQPCNHRYMCDDCAIKIFRLFKKCKVCHGKIEEITVEAY